MCYLLIFPVTRQLFLAKKKGSRIDKPAISFCQRISRLCHYLGNVFVQTLRFTWVCSIRGICMHPPSHLYVPVGFRQALAASPRVLKCSSISGSLNNKSKFALCALSYSSTGMRQVLEPRRAELKCSCKEHTELF